MFREIDVDGGGKILFDEFAHWAIEQDLDLEDDDDAEKAGAGSGLIGRPKKSKKKKKPNKKTPAARMVDWAAVAEKLPWGTDDESTAKRKQLFRQVLFSIPPKMYLGSAKRSTPTAPYTLS